MSLLADNIRFLRLQSGLTQEQFAMALEVPRSRIGSYEESRSEPSVDMLIKIADYFKIPVDALLRNKLASGKGSAFIILGNHRVLFPISVNQSDDDLIEVVPIKASAGYLDGYADPEFIESLEKMTLPFLGTGKFRAFPIKGDSMLPMKEGSIVVGRFVEQLTELKIGKTHVVLTKNDGVVYKRIDKGQDEQHLKFVSDNKLYASYQVHKSDIIELWEYTCSINLEEFSEEELKISKLEQMFNELGEELRGMRKVVG